MTGTVPNAFIQFTIGFGCLLEKWAIQRIQDRRIELFGGEIRPISKDITYFQHLFFGKWLFGLVPIH